jgi:hypothetical protein
MKDNLEKVLERDAKLTSLEDRASILNKKNSFLKLIIAFFRCLTKWCITIYSEC